MIDREPTVPVRDEVSSRPSMAHAVASQLTQAFDAGPIAPFRANLARHVELRRWILASDYNWRDRTRPQDVLAFTLYPDPGDIRQLAADLARRFPADLKKTRVITPGSLAWFREGHAFHLCVVLDKIGSMLARGSDRREVARESITETRAYLERSRAPAWIIDRIRGLERFSQATNFNMNLYNDVVVLSIVYATIVGLIARERPIERVLWCSDRDDRTSWGERILDTYGLVSACQWAGQHGQRFDAAQFPLLVLPASGADPCDALIRPADYLAGALASWDLTRGTGTQAGEKYGKLLREAISANPDIAVLHLRLDHLIHATRIEIIKTELPPD